MRNWQIFTRAHKSLKTGTFIGTFIQSRKCGNLKITVELFIMAMKNDAKTEEELTSQFKIEMRNLINFDSSSQKSKKCAPYLLLNKVYYV